MVAHLNGLTRLTARIKMPTKKAQLTIMYRNLFLFRSYFWVRVLKGRVKYALFCTYWKRARHVMRVWKLVYQ